ncbi:hypothetical protein DFS34DRAFT_651076 [Phlyctochytrium arcticum]|nr:hypothetical protein DFS34DRAFT_651076 [Phlyctochytrium arcticum]
MPRRSMQGIAQLCFLPSPPPPEPSSPSSEETASPYSWFQGHLIPNSHKSSSSISILGVEADQDSHPPLHPCCPKTPFWALTFRDWNVGTVGKVVVQQTRDVETGCRMTTEWEGCEDLHKWRRRIKQDGQDEDNDEEEEDEDVEEEPMDKTRSRGGPSLSFISRVVKVDQDAKQHMEKFFPQLEPTADAVICIGEMSFTRVGFTYVQNQAATSLT